MTGENVWEKKGSVSSRDLENKKKILPKVADPYCLITFQIDHLVMKANDAGSYYINVLISVHKKSISFWLFPFDQKGI